MPETPDLDALAKQYGGTVSPAAPAAPPPGTDLDALAKQYGGTVSSAAPPPDQQGAQDISPTGTVWGQYNPQTQKWEPTAAPGEPGLEPGGAGWLQRALTGGVQRGWQTTAAAYAHPAFGLEEVTPQTEEEIEGPPRAIGQAVSDAWDLIKTGNPMALTNLGPALAKHITQFPDWVQNLVAGKKIPESVGAGALDLFNTYLTSGRAPEINAAQGIDQVGAAARDWALAHPGVVTGAAKVGGGLTGAATGATIGSIIGKEAEHPLIGGTLGARELTKRGWEWGGKLGEWALDKLEESKAAAGSPQEVLNKAIEEEFPKGNIPESTAAIPADWYKQISEANPKLTDRQIRGIGEQLMKEMRPGARPTPQPATAPVAPPTLEEQAVQPPVTRPEQAKTYREAQVAATMKVMITKSEEARLRFLGYSQDEIDKMTPQEVNDILAKQKRKQAP